MFAGVGLSSSCGVRWHEKALELFKLNADQIDLIIMDVVMPSLSGPEAYLEMSAMRPGIRVIFTTGYTPKSIGPCVQWSKKERRFFPKTIQSHEP